MGKVSSYSTHSLVLDTNGCVWCFGGDGLSKLGLDEKSSILTPRKNENILVKITQVATGNSHSMMLDETGNVWYCGMLFTHVENFPIQLPNLPAIKSIFGTLLLDAQGCVWTNESSGTNQPKKFLQLSNLPEIIQIVGRESHSLFIDVDHNVWVTGSNLWNRIALDDIDSTSSPVILPNLPPITQVSTGTMHSLFLDSEGSVWGCGSSERGQLGTSRYVSQISKIPGLPPIQLVCAGATHSIFLDVNGQVWVCGGNSCGQLGLGDTKNKFQVQQIQNIPEMQDIAAGMAHSFFIDYEGNAWSCGSNDFGQLGHGDLRERDTPKKSIHLTGIVQLRKAKQPRIKSARSS